MSNTKAAFPPGIPVDPAKVAHERDLVRAILAAQTDEAHEAACVAVASYFESCLQCVADALSLYHDDLEDDATLAVQVDTFMDTLDRLADDPLSHEGRCVLLEAAP